MRVQRSWCAHLVTAGDASHIPLVQAYNICAQICREMRGGDPSTRLISEAVGAAGVMGLTAPKSSLGLIAGTNAFLH